MSPQRLCTDGRGLIHTLLAGTFSHTPSRSMINRIVSTRRKKKETLILFCLFLSLLTTQYIVVDDAANQPASQPAPASQSDKSLRFVHATARGLAPDDPSSSSRKQASKPNKPPAQSRHEFEESFGRPAYNKVAWSALHCTALHGQSVQSAQLIQK